jgi:glycolate oxidase FAD binding subunit
MTLDATLLPLTETIEPADQAAVAEAVRNAAGRQMPVYPLGGGTRLDYGGKPTLPGIGLSLAKLNRVVDYPAADLTITVEAGTTIADLNRLLAGQRQRLPIDIPQPDRATVGGAVAVNAAGPRRYAYGAMRDYLLGMTAVDGNGVPFSGGGRVVKNAAGYNMCRLMAGSLGTLGVLAQVTLMVRPMPEASALLLGNVSNFDMAERLLAALVRSPARPVAVDFVAGRLPANDQALEGVPEGPLPEGNVGRLYVGFEGAVAEVAWMVEQLRDGWIAVGAAAPMLVPAAAAEPWWRWLVDFPANVQMGVLPGAVVATVAEIVRIDPQCAIQAHAGDGVIRVSIPLPSGEGRREGDASAAKGSSAVQQIAQLRAVAAAAGGKMIVLRPADGFVPTVADVWGPPGPEMRLMRAIKERFDPQNILNPGRFSYG